MENLCCKVTIACDGERLSLLQKEFPHIDFLLLEGYHITYTNNKRLLPLKILRQSPKILQKIRKENRWLQQTIIERKIDAVISDNRFGLYTKQVPCIFITHQLQIKAPFNWLEKLIRQINYRYINRYTECWVPDLEGNINIAGSLSHPGKLPDVPVKYLGPLSRIKTTGNRVKKYDWLMLLSGPEPQRSLLEEKIRAAIPYLKGNVLFARGKPGLNEEEQVGTAVKIVSHLAGNELQKAFEESEYVLSRSGYTTVMELLQMKKKALLIPTPGQTEQEYLAKHLLQQKWSYTCTQENDLPEEMAKATIFPYNLPDLPGDQLHQVMQAFISKYLPGNS